MTTIFIDGRMQCPKIRIDVVHAFGIVKAGFKRYPILGDQDLRVVVGILNPV